MKITKLKSPLLSVVLTTYNERKSSFLLCVNSVLKQTYRNFELIIVFEPNDFNINEIKEFTKNDERVIIIVNDQKKGFVKSLNIGVKKSLGDFIARIDSDDFCEKERFQLQIDYFLKNNDIDVIGTNINLINDSNQIVGKRYYKKTFSDIKKAFLLSTSIAHPTVIIRKKCLIKYGLYDENFIYSEDLELWLRLIKNNCKFANLDKCLVNYRVISIDEKRNSDHWKYNYRARLKHSFGIWNPLYAITTLSFALLMSLLPVKMLNILIASSLSNKLKGKKVKK
jgi:glycosyltransferase involved in cell wall biosynthesis